MKTPLAARFVLLISAFAFPASAQSTGDVVINVVDSSDTGTTSRAITLVARFIF